MYSISFSFENDTLFGHIRMPIENKSNNAPAAKFIEKQLSKLNCKIIEHTCCWGFRTTPNRKRCTYTPMIKFTGSTEAMQQLVALYGQPSQKVPLKPTKVFQDKFLWRSIVRPLFPKGTGTPFTVCSRHLSALEEAAQRLDEFTTSSYSDGRVHYTGISRSDLSSVHELIKAVREDGEALVVD